MKAAPTMPSKPFFRHLKEAENGSCGEKGAAPKMPQKFPLQPPMRIRFGFEQI
jgi:hypothetical protein